MIQLTTAIACYEYNYVMIRCRCQRDWTSGRSLTSRRSVLYFGRYEGSARQAPPEGARTVVNVMSIRTRVVLVIIGLMVLAVVINLLRTRRLKEEYALLWLVAALSLVVGPLLIDPLDALDYFLGVDYPPAVYLGVGIIGLLLILFQLSLNISRFSDTIRVLTQEVAILSQRVQGLEQRLEPPQETDAEED